MWRHIRRVREGTPGNGSAATPTPRPWAYLTAEPSFADMLAVLRRTLIAARFTGVATVQTTDQQIREVQQAWASAAA